MLINEIIEKIISHQEWSNTIPLWRFTESWYENQSFWVSENTRRRHFYFFWKNWYWRLNSSRRLIDNDLKNNRWFLIVWTESNLVDYALSKMSDAQKLNIINIDADIYYVDDYSDFINTWKYLLLSSNLFLSQNIETLRSILGKIIISGYSRSSLPSDKRIDYAFYLNNFERYIDLDIFDSIVSEFRKYNISLVLSNSSDSINEKYLPVILGNVWTIIAFHQKVATESMLLKFFEKSVSDFSELDIWDAFVKCVDFVFMEDWKYIAQSFKVNIE